MCTQRYINQNNKWLINQLRVQIYRSKNFDQPINRELTRARKDWDWTKATLNLINEKSKILRLDFGSSIFVTASYRCLLI